MTDVARSANPLIDPGELASQLSGGHPPLLLDVRPAEQFAAGHLPGALHLDLWGVSLIDTSPAPLRAFMWMVGHLFSLRGVTPDRPVVVYEQDSGLRAARVFWLLEYLAHPNVRVLDGGLRSWTTAGFSVTLEAAAPVPGTWHGTPQDDRIAAWTDVLERLHRPGTVVIDTRSRDEFVGRTVRAKRGGAIPGAVNLEWTRNLAADGRYKAPPDLAPMYAHVGVTSDQTVITYCQGGYRAAHTYLALRRLGFADVRNYTGSWKEWGDREDLPIVMPQAAPPE